MLSRTNIKRLEAMPDCPFATDSCFCTEHFAGKKTMIERTIGSIAAVTTRETAVNTSVDSCPKGRIMLVGNTAYSVGSIFTKKDY